MKSAGQRSLLRRFLGGDVGASAVEYGLLVAGIAVVIILAVFALGDSISGVFTKTSTCLSSATPDPATCK